MGTSLDSSSGRVKWWIRRLGNPKIVLLRSGKTLLKWGHHFFAIYVARRIDWNYSQNFCSYTVFQRFHFAVTRFSGCQDDVLIGYRMRNRRQAVNYLLIVCDEGENPQKTPASGLLGSAGKTRRIFVSPPQRVWVNFSLLPLFGKLDTRYMTECSINNWKKVVNGEINGHRRKLAP